ncbi:MAG TPA: glucan ABC transporter ATP-binding protein/ permease [Rhizobiaceae bacterium]|nr:glucan ABC transporter ATP-binding protein/ permease [Rhizobiaceae bacterium]
MRLLDVYLRALSYFGAEKRKVALICSANVALAMVVVVEPILFGEIIDAIATQRDFFQTLAVWAGFGAFNILAYVLVARGADRLAHDMRARVLGDGFEKVLAMPLAWHHSRGTSNALHMLLRAAESLFGLWLEFMRQHLATGVALCLLVPTALAVDVRMSIVLFLLGTSYVVINRVVMKHTKEGQASVERHYHRVFSHVSDAVSNVAVLQGYGRVSDETRRLREYAAELVSAQRPVLDWWALASALQRLASTASMMIVLVIGAFLVSRGEIRIGDIVAFTGFAALLISRLDQVTGFVNQVFDARAKLEDFYKLEDASAARAEPSGSIEIDRVQGNVVFDNVSFRFPDSNAGVEDVSFNVEAGKTVAIVGATGAGKTTLVNLLQRVYDPQHGAIRVDGLDTRLVTRASLRHNIATVFQDAGLLNRSIEENIRLGRSDASYDDIHLVAQAAACHDFILAKREGYDTVAGERGGQLSGGERQRVAIARAMLKEAPILVLDEATSALDVETEKHVKEAIDRLRANRTTFIIAHRLSTVRGADLVLVMDGGRIVEQGSFEELSRSSGRFASLLRAGGLLGEDGRSHIRLAHTSEAAA